MIHNYLQCGFNCRSYVLHGHSRLEAAEYLAFTADAPVLLIVVDQALIGCLNIPLGCLVLQSVLRHIPLQPDFLGRYQLDIIEFSSIGLEKAFDMFQVFPFRWQVKIHHHSIDKTFLICLSKSS